MLVVDRIPNLGRQNFSTCGDHPVVGPEDDVVELGRSGVVGEPAYKAGKQGKTAPHDEIRLKGMKPDALEPTHCLRRQLQTLLPRADLGVRPRYLIALHLGCRCQTSGDGDGLLPGSFLLLEVVEYRAHREYDQSDRDATQKRKATVGCNSAAIDDVAGLQLGRLRLFAGAECQPLLG
jgi:hypothetical protein